MIRKPLTISLQAACFAACVVLAGCSSDESPTSTAPIGTPISGNQSGTIGSGGQVYHVTDTLRVPAGQTLTILAGTVFKFAEGIPMEVLGKIVAEGTEASPILFTSAETYPHRGDWDGVWLIGADNTSSFKYCRFEFGAKYGRRYTSYDAHGNPTGKLIEYGSISLKHSSPTIERCWFVWGGFHGVACDDTSNPVIKNCVFRDNAGHGMYIGQAANPTVTSNIIVENDDYGIYCAMPGEDKRATLNLNHNIIWSNFSGEFNAQSPDNLKRAVTVNSNLDSCDNQNNLRRDPRFADANLADFHLTSCSGAIKAGPGGSDLGIYAYPADERELRRLITVATLRKALSPYYVTCDAIIPEGQTLTVEPGVEVLFRGRYSIRVLGTLVTQGTASQNVTFKSGMEPSAKGDWVGLILPSTAPAGTELHYTNIYQARLGLRITANDPLIDHCSISFCDSVGVICEAAAAPRILDTRFESNSITGVYCENSSPIIRRSTFIDGAGYAVLAVEASLPVITNCIFNGAAVTGVRLENLSNAVIRNNVFAFNGYYGIYCSNNSSPDVRNNIFYRNGTPEANNSVKGGNAVYGRSSSLPTIFYNAFVSYNGPGGTPVPIVDISNDNQAYDHATNILRDPNFVNAAGGDFHLQAGSPCRGAGDPAYPNPGAGVSDMGAYGGPEAGN